ncbi:MAG TPA: GspH/FimT family pseudopilin [Gemmatimonadales bacterium]|nr:GspH/FimT family pseudopilin [Gemmatimonadales bacterium]
MRQGITLVELLIVMTLVSLLGMITLPRLARPLASLRVEQEAHRIAAAHARARMLAVTSSRVALLRITADSMTIRTVEGPDTLLRWRGPGPAAAGVSLTAPDRTLYFAPIGITYGVSNGTWTLAYRGAVRRVIMSRLGRIRVERQ